MATHFDHRDPWHAESDAFADGAERGDYDVAEAAELPAELLAHAEAAALDPSFVDTFAVWLDRLLTDDDSALVLALEQSCHLGKLLRWDERGVRLSTLPPATLSRLHWLLGACPRHVLVHLASYTYWLLRSERARRRGSPDWSPSLPLPPMPWWQQDPPAFKPMRSWPRRWP